MRGVVNYFGRGAWADPSAMERRLVYGMIAASMLAVCVAAPIASWRVTTGLFFGGALAVLNYRWLYASIGSAFGPARAGGQMQIGAARVLFRYFVLAVIVGAAWHFDIVSLGATLAGLCSFAAAALVEAFIQICMMFVYGREA